MNHRRLACAFIFVLIFVQNLYDRSLAYGLVLSERLKNDTLTSELSLIKDELAYLQSEIKKLTLLTTQRSPHFAFETPGRFIPNNLRQWGYINAAGAPYNASGNGISDDTGAIQRALNDCKNQGGGIVWLPAATYFIAGTLVVNANCILKGVASAPTRTWGTSQNTAGTTLLAVSGHGNAQGTPFITLQGHNAGVEGLSIFYPKQTATNPPVPYPWTIQVGPGGWENVFVQNVLLVNSYNGIDFASNNGGPRHYIRNVFGQPLNIGITIDQCYDIGRISTIHFWPFWSSNQNLLQYINNNAVTIVLKRTDWEIVDNVFSWGYHVGLQLASSSYGSSNGQLSNINFDNVDVGIDVYQTQPPGILISNLNVANAGGGTMRVAIWGHPNGNAHLVIRGGSFWGQLNGVLLWQMDAGHVALSDSIISEWNPQNPAIVIKNGRALITTNYFRDLVGTAIVVDSSADRVLIASNELIGNKIINNGKHTVMSGNDP